MSAPSPSDPIDWIESIASADPARIWLTVPAEQSTSYGQLEQSVVRMAGLLHAAGVSTGDRVAVQTAKSAEALILYFACLWLGAVILPLNPDYTPAEIDYFIGDAEPVLFVGEADAAHRPPGVRFETLESLAAREPAALGERPHFPPDTLAAMLYTSGTTGRPKGAMLTRGNLASNAATLVEAWGITANDVLIHALPIFHVHGLFIAVNSMTAAGAGMILLPKFDAGAILSLLPKATILMGVPTFYTRLLSAPGLTREACADMRLFISGSAPLLAETHDIFAASTGHAILERYGMTETGINTSNPLKGARMAGTVGPPLPGVELRVVDPVSRRELPQGEIGMIEVSGPNVFAGYWRNPEKTDAEFRADGFFVTGDLGKIDGEGYVHIVGRGKDLIISGGFNVYPKEVEEAIDALPGVLESAVIGLPHPDFGEAVTAVVVPADGAALDESQMSAALSESLARYKLPKAIHFVAELPRNAMGKVQKAALRERFHPHA